MTETPYNGWTNRETWNAYLWMGNEPGLYHTARALALEGDAYDASKTLRAWWEELFFPEGDPGPLSDAWIYAMSVTNWYEIIEAFRE